MTRKTLRILTAVISVVLALVVGWSITAGNFVVPIVAVVLAIGLSYFLRRATKDVTRDERTTLLYEKAAGATIRFCVPLAAFVGIILFALRQRLSVELVSAGYVLAYVACVLLLVHLAFYSYYSRKH
jgi:uncharacterized membrane protein